MSFDHWRVIADRLFRPAVLKDTHETGLVRDFFGGRPGVFVEVGANDPKYCSQTYHLERIGWTGILVEPLPHLAERLKRERRARVFAVACGAPEHHGAAMPMMVGGTAGGLSTLCDTMRETGMDRASAGADRIIQVPVRTLDSILDEAGVERIDFLSIDVEGFEIEVLKGFDLRRYRPRLVLIEDDVTSHAKHRAMRKLGYRLVRRTALNNWYVPDRAEQDVPVSAYGRVQLFRKLYLGYWPRRLKGRLRMPRRRRPRRDANGT